jgi:hypothetical protein
LQRTNENYLRWQLGRAVKKKHAPNVTMLQADDASAADLEPGERAVALIALGSGGPPLVVTDARLVESGQTLLRYDDLRHCHWIIRDHKKRNLDTEAARELKRRHFQRLVLDLRDGREVVLDGLGQAVFPLLKFFWFTLERDQKRRDNPPKQRAGG